MTDAEVKAKLTIEQDGEPQALRDAADALTAITAALQGLEAAAGTAFAPILAQLDQVIAKANEAAAALAQLTTE
jgi:D-serine deaminase-like pyridoxal phosphate-dependent protein